MQIGYIFLFMIFSCFISEACTIGIASGYATTDGRPLIWKNRDVSAPVVVHYYDEFPIRFIGVGNSGSEYIWMGVNENGFAILNAVANFPVNSQSRMGNGDTMKWALGHFSRTEEFEAFLDSTNITGRETHANMSVIDSTGSAIMYEVSETDYWIFDTNDTEAGFVVRANFAFNGGGTSSSRYERGNEIIGELVAENNLNVGNVLHSFIREFNNGNAEHIPVPFLDRWNDDDPFGYFPIQGISGTANGSAVVIQGVTPEEKAKFSTMWTLLGKPSTTAAFPCFPVGTPPSEANDQGNSPLYARSQEIEAQLFDYSNPNYIDSYKLLHNDTGFWQQVFEQENYFISIVDSLKDNWQIDTPDDQQMLDLQDDLASDALNFLNEVIIETEIVPDFRCDIRYGIPELEVQFQETSLHNPGFNYWLWDFDNDGVTDSSDRDPLWIYTEAGNYSVTCGAGNDSSSFTITKENFICVRDSITEIIVAEPDSLFFQTVEEAGMGLPLQLFNELEIEIELSNIEWEYFEPQQDFPVSIPAGDFLELTIFVPLPVLERDITLDHLIIQSSNGTLQYPIYIDTDLYSEAENCEIIPSSGKLLSFPNPFSTETTFFFSAAQKLNHAKIEIYNLKGQLIDEIPLCNIKTGLNKADWDARKFSSGIYFSRISCREKVSENIHKMILLK